MRDGKDLLLRGDTDGDATTAEVDLRLKNVASLGAADIKFQLDPVVSVTDVITETEAVPVAEAVQGLVIDLGQQPEVADASGNAGDDTLTGNGDDNRLDGGAGDDTLDGRNDNDTLNGDGGNDVLNGGEGDDILDGGDGVDTADYADRSCPVSVILRDGRDSKAMVSGQAEDTLRNIENITGGSAGDHLTGNKGANILKGRDGDDTLVGGGGADRFVYTPDSFGDDVILDFDAAGGDRIDLAMKNSGGTGLSWNPDGPQAWSCMRISTAMPTPTSASPCAGSLIWIRAP